MTLCGLLTDPVFVDLPTVPRSIGTPSGGCNNMSAGGCHADITPFVTKLCVGKATCSIVADINVVNGGKDPCPGVAKSVYAELVCSGSSTFPIVSSHGLVGYAPGQVHIVWLLGSKAMGEGGGDSFSVPAP